MIFGEGLGRPVDQPKAEATRLGSYEIVRKLARGGMAELFLAKTVGPEGFEKLVVLKKILPSHAENPKFVRLFLDEAKLVATLDHPHIAHVYDMGKVDGNYFFAMEYVHGQDVRSTLRRTSRLDRKFPIDHAVHIARNIAAALHYAHQRKRPDGALLDIVHRDVSPSNILISYDGAVKLVDFGVAKAATSTVKTRTGTLKGKISYMSPEQAKGSPIDRRSDIFSLGIVLWEMVTTQRLFKSDNDLATIQMIINSKAEAPSS
jgi:serine/threonine-protein kinase